MRNLIRGIVARLPESGKMRLTRVRRPKMAYLLRQPDAPISDCLGMDRGTPVDRHFIESFLKDSGRYIRGVCLEVMGDEYTRKFGQGVTRADVLDIDRSNPRANVVGDLRHLDCVADDSYDSFICTQVLHYIDDVDAAVREMGRILRPGGSALVTLPTLHVMEGRHPHYWKFSTHSARYLFGKYFREDQLDVRAWGNVMTGVASWVGLAQEDLPKGRLDKHDPRFACTITVRATKAAASGAARAGATTDGAAAAASA